MKTLSTTLILALVFFSVAVAATPSKNVQQSLPTKQGYSYVAPVALPIVSQTFPLPSFSRVRINQPVSLKIIVGGQRSLLKITANPRLVRAAVAQVRQGRFSFQYRHPLATLHTLHHPAMRPQLVLYTPQLNGLEQLRSANVEVIYQQPQSLVIQKSGSGSLRVLGKRLNLLKLKNTGNGLVSVSGIHSSAFAVDNQSRGRMILRGSKLGLRVLRVSGDPRMVVSHLQSPHLVVETHMDETGLVTLKGEANLASLTARGSGRFRLEWVDSEVMHIRIQRRAHVNLAGVAKAVDARVSHQGRLDLRFLRAGTVFVSTQQHAIAHVQALHNLFALAENSSDIYYYRKPPFLSATMRQSGAILAMQNVPSALLNFQGSREPRRRV